MTGRLRLSGQLICASAEELETVRRLLPEHIRLSREEPGCVSFEIGQTDDPMVWRLEECFIDRAAFEAHRARSRASVWGPATASIRREREISEDD